MPEFPLLSIAVLDKGFVYFGRCNVADGFLTISNAQNIRRWGTSRGLGQLATEGPTKDSVLDPVPEVLVPFHALIHLIPCKPEAWTKYGRTA